MSCDLDALSASLGLEGHPDAVGRIVAAARELDSLAMLWFEPLLDVPPAAGGPEPTLESLTGRVGFGLSPSGLLAYLALLGGVAHFPLTPATIHVPATSELPELTPPRRR